MKQISIDRIGTLINFARTLPPEADAHFAMRVWYSHSGGHLPSDNLMDCGTTGCMLGWATQIPEFRRLGLRFSEDTYGDFLYLGSAVNRYVVFGNYVNSRAASEFFDISYERAMDLFVTPDDIHTLKGWADMADRRLTEWVNEDELADRVRKPDDPHDGPLGSY